MIMTKTLARSPSDFSKEQIFIELFNEYSAHFTQSKMFGWNFEEKSKDLFVAINDKVVQAFGFIPSEFSDWVEKQPRETLLGIIPVPDFSKVLG